MMTRTLRHLITFMATLLAIADAHGTVPPKTTDFMENIGQVVDQHGLPNEQVLFLMHRPGLNLQLRPTGFSYEVWVDASKAAADSEPDLAGGPSGRPGSTGMDITFQTYRVDVEILGARQARVVTEAPLSWTTNHYTAAGGFEGVKQFERVTYQDVLPNIDLVFALNAHGFPKYDIVVRPGGDGSALRLAYHGANALALQHGELHIGTPLGPIVERIPASYTLPGRAGIQVGYVVWEDGTVSMNIPPYPSGSTLVIDPEPIHGSFFGGPGYDYGLAVAVYDGRTSITGETASLLGIATEGSHQHLLQGNSDAFLASFDQHDQLLWCTYLGGAGREYGHGIVALDGALYLCGHSTGNTPFLGGAGAQPLPPGGGDAFLARFSTQGELIWGTYYGGNGSEAALSLAHFDGHLYMTGYTFSDQGVATMDAHQPTRTGGRDAFLACFALDGEQRWGTYMGGPNMEIGHGIAVNGDGVFMAGWTGSASGVAFGEVHQGFFMFGSWDAFLARYTHEGTLNWCTYYGGGNGGQGTGVAVATDGVYLVGATESGQYIASPGAFQPAIGGGGWDGFIAKFDLEGQRLWGSFYGGMDTDVLTGIVASEEGIHVTGYSSSVYVMGSPSTHQPAFAGGYADAVVARFTPQGQRVWGTYHGGLLGDQGMGIAADDRGIHLVGYTGSLSGIVFGDAYQTGNAGSVDTFLATYPYSTVGTEEHDQRSSSIGVYPNPATERVHLNVPGLASGGILRMYDPAGRVVVQQATRPGQDTLQIDVAALAPGSYTVELQDREGRRTARVVVQR